MPLVTLTTDFGTTDPFVGIMKGVILARTPEATIVDLSHGVPPQAVLAGALVLRHATPWFPPGTVHLGVVDPGVGTERRPLCVETARGALVGPDNGLLSLAAGADGIRRIVHLTDEAFFLAPRSATFHGRDVFAPVAAALAAGTPPAALGTEVGDLERLRVPPLVSEGGGLRGEVLYVDHFGNLVTNVDAERLAAFRGRAVSITLRDVRLTAVVTSYTAAAPGEPIALVNSWGLLEIAVRNGSARSALGAGVGDIVVVRAG
jgi:S-adenosylmethionine hydrolase